MLRPDCLACLRCWPRWPALPARRRASLRTLAKAGSARAWPTPRRSPTAAWTGRGSGRPRLQRLHGLDQLVARLLVWHLRDCFAFLVGQAGCRRLASSLMCYSFVTVFTSDTTMPCFKVMVSWSPVFTLSASSSTCPSARCTTAYPRSSVDCGLSAVSDACAFSMVRLASSRIRVRPISAFLCVRHQGNADAVPTW